MIRLNVDENALETGVGLEEIVKKVLWYQVFYKDAIGKDIRLMKLQKNMYEAKDERPITFKKIKFDGTYNLLKPLCDTAKSTFLSRVPDISTIGSDKEKAKISALVLMQKHNDFEEEIDDVALQMGQVGSGFLCLYADEGDTFPHYRSLDPLYTNVVYDCSIAMKRLFAYHIYFEQTALGGRYVCIIYTKKKMYSYYTTQISIPAKMTFSVFPLNLFLLNGMQYSNVAEHGFSDIPIVEFQNNKLCISDCRPVLTIIGLYSALQNNRFQNVDDIINYLLLIKNARIGDEKETNAALSLIRNNRVLPLEGDNVDAKFLSNPLNQTDIQTLANEYKNMIHYISHIPDFQSVEFTQNASDPILKAKTKPLLDLCIEKEKWFNRGFMKVLELTLNFVKDYSKETYAKVGFDLDKVDLVYSHALPSNDIDMVNAVVNLSNAGLNNPRITLQGLSFIPNVDDYLKGMYEHNEYVDKRKEQTQNKDKGTNETNIERQNATPQTKEQATNMKNFVNGVAQNISDNKVE